jgi:ribosomal protein S18 acetylase RimI-like enzyme
MMNARSREVLVDLQARSQLPTVRLRRAGFEDAPRVTALGARLFLQAYEGRMDPDDIALHLAECYGVARQEEELRAADTAIWIAEVGEGEPVGFAMLRRRALPVEPGAMHGIELARLYVDRDWQGHRLGATLLATCVSEARAWGGDLLWLSVWMQNERAIAFYKRLGLRIVGEADFIVGADRQRDHVMALALR